MTETNITSWSDTTCKNTHKKQIIYYTHIATDVVRSVVCVFGTQVGCAKLAEPVWKADLGEPKEQRIRCGRLVARQGNIHGYAVHIMHRIQLLLSGNATISMNHHCNITMTEAVQHKFIQPNGYTESNQWSGSSSFSDLVYTDDTAFFVKDASDATDCLSSFSQSFSVFGLRISWAKTKLQSLGSDSVPNLLNFMVDGNSINAVLSFTYLSSVQTYDGYCRSDITRQIGLTSSAMSSLRNI